MKNIKLKRIVIDVIDGKIRPHIVVEVNTSIEYPTQEGNALAYVGMHETEVYPTLDRKAFEELWHSISSKVNSLDED